MYSYYFAFYKPGKKFYNPKELADTLDALHGANYDVVFHPRDPHVKRNRIQFNKRETRLDIEIRKSGRILSFHLGPAEGDQGRMAGLSMPGEHFTDDFPNDHEGNAQILSEAAMIITSTLKPLFAWGDHELELDKLEPFLRFDRIGAMAWANFFSKELIERLGGIDKVLLRPEDKQYRQGAEGTLRELSFVPITLFDSPTQDIPPMVALECERRYPGAILTTFEIPAKNAIEVEP